MIVCFFFFPPHVLLTEQTFIRMAAFAGGGYSLESCIERFVFPYKGYSDQAIPLLFREREENTLTFYNLSPVLTNCSLTALIFNNSINNSINSILIVKPHLEVNWRRRIFRFYPDNTWLHFWRGAEIILPYLIKREISTLRHREKPCWK